MTLHCSDVISVSVNVELAQSQIPLSSLKSVCNAAGGGYKTFRFRPLRHRSLSQSHQDAVSAVSGTSLILVFANCENKSSLRLKTSVGSDPRKKDTKKTQATVSQSNILAKMRQYWKQLQGSVMRRKKPEIKSLVILTP